MKKTLIFLLNLNFILIYLHADQEMFSEENTLVYIEPSSSTITPYGAYAFGKTIGIDKDYGVAGVMVASKQSGSLVFTDVNWIHFTNRRYGTELGIGVRYGDEEKFFGFNAYYDWLAYRSKSLNQLSFGMEAFFCNWELRANAYLPLNRRITVRKISQDYPGGYFFRSQTRVFACQLATVTLGRRFDFSWLSATILGGPYWVSVRKHKQNYGGLADISLDITNYLQLRTVISRDSYFKTRAQGIVSLSIPLGCCCDWLCSCLPTFEKRPLRQASIATDTKQCCLFNW